jgi:hypothetical protein
MAFKAYRSDRRKAKRGDPHWCLLALGVRRHKDVLDVYIGAGKDAYVVFKGRDGEGPFAVHFIIGTSVRRLIDGFDKDKSARTQEIILRHPPKSLTMEHRRNNNRRRAAEIKAGAKVNRRGKIAQTRITRIGVATRPRARVSESGSVSAAQAA